MRALQSLPRILYARIEGGAMIYGSVCSGIEAATIAWEPLGWQPSFFSEIEPFPRAVLQHHWGSVPLHGDFTTIQENNYGPIDLLVGGTPCQSFSVAGLRRGMDDDRGNLALEYLKLAKRLRPQWLVWENVPGVLSSGEGRDFGSFLGGLGELGYGFAYRVLDAQYFGVPQRRRRVFVIGYIGDWRPPAAVLFERESLRWNPPPRREAGKNIAGTLEAGIGRRRGAGQKPESLIAAPTAYGGNNTSGSIEVSTAVKGNNGNYDFESETFIAIQANTTAEGAESAGEDVCPAMRGHHNPPAIAFKSSHYTRGKDGAPNTIAPPLSADADKGDQDTLVMAVNYEQGLAPHGSMELQDVTPALSASEEKGHTLVFDTTQVTNPNNRSNPQTGDPCHTLAPGSHPPAALADMQVRRLTPIECERLQGFPDNYTRITWRKKTAEECPDGPRYKAIGNSMAVPIMHWIGSRIQMVDELLKRLAA